jgi:hypothetical protein
MKNFTYASDTISKDISSECDFNRFLLNDSDLCDVHIALVIVL